MKLEDMFEQLSATSPMLRTRRVWPGDPPPAPPPDEAAVWNEFEGMWVETDESFRRRLLDGQ